MKAHRNILVVCNGTDDYVTLAGQLASLLAGTAADLTLLKVIGEAPERPVMALQPNDLAQVVIAHHETALDGLAAALASNGMRATPRVVTGEPLREIRLAALAGSYDLIVKSSERRKGDRRRSSGGLDQRLLRSSPHPLLLLGETMPSRLHRVMVAVDVEQDSRSYALTLKLLETGQRISRATGAALHVFHAWQAPAEDAIRYRVAAELADEYQRNTRSRQWQLLTRALRGANLDSSAIRFHFERGLAQQLVPQIVRDDRIDLLVIGTVGRRGLSGALIGNTAEAVLRQVEIPVLSVPRSAVAAWSSHSPQMNGDTLSSGCASRRGTASLLASTRRTTTRARPTAAPDSTAHIAASRNRTP